MAPSHVRVSSQLLTDATLESGCLHFLPREFDAGWARPERADHLRAATRSDVERGATRA